MTDVPRTSPELSIIGPLGVPLLGPIDAPWTSTFTTFEYLFFQSKKCNRCVKQRPLHPKKTHFCWSPKCPQTLGPLGDLQGTSPGRRVPAGKADQPAPSNANGILKNTTIAVLLKYLSSFLRSLEMAYQKTRTQGSTGP